MLTVAGAGVDEYTAPETSWGWFDHKETSTEMISGDRQRQADHMTTT